MGLAGGIEAQPGTAGGMGSPLAKVVAGLAVTLVSSSAVVPAAGFLLLCGSRLGAASFIMLLGLLEYARTRPRPPLARALGLGFVTFLVGLSVYLPATAIGYAFFSPLHDRMTARLPARFDVGFISRSEELTTGLVDVVGPLPVAVIGVVLAVASLRLFDAFLDGVDEDEMRRRLRRWLRFRGVSFSAGLIVSALTTSIALSVGALVPLFARGMVKAREMIPYVLGAGLGTMADTVLVALILGSPSAVAVTIVLLATAAVLTLVYLAAGATYTNAVEGLYCALAASPQRAATFAAVLVAFPALLFLVV